MSSFVQMNFSQNQGKWMNNKSVSVKMKNSSIVGQVFLFHPINLKVCLLEDKFGLMELTITDIVGDI